MDLIIFEQDKKFVINSFKDGKFDYVDGVTEIAERRFFKYVFGEGIMKKLAETYPTPRKKKEVPLWLYLASNISLRLKGWHSFHSYPWVIRCGGLINALDPSIARKRIDPKTGNLILECRGFNNKNHYKRQTPCDQDFLRKMARDTEVEKLHLWYNRDVVKCLKDMKSFDSEGIFIGDASYIFVPDNPSYEGSCRLLFDEHNHPVNPDKISIEQRLKCQWRRCYKLVSLIHTNWEQDFFLYAGIRVTRGKDHECPILYEMVEQFVNYVGKGIMKVLIVDRGFLDGESIGKCKSELGVDVIVAPRKNMDILQDALGIIKIGEVEWKELKIEEFPKGIETIKPEAIEKREKSRRKTLALKKSKKNEKKSIPVVKRLVGGIKEFTSWESCTVPLNVVINREIYSDGHEQQWYLITTMDFEEPQLITEYYGKRSAIEERHRQIKCFWNLTNFKSQAFSLVVNQIIFVALSYTFLQLHLLKLAKSELNRLTLPRLQQELLPGTAHIVLYYKQRFTFLLAIEYQKLLLTLSEYARRKILKKTRKLEREFFQYIRGP
jgi:hypothetical protein